MPRTGTFTLPVTSTSGPSATGVEIPGSCWCDSCHAHMGMRPRLMPYSSDSGRSAWSAARVKSVVTATE
jgi:hypothetical protein